MHFRCLSCEGEATLAIIEHRETTAYTPEGSEGVLVTNKQLIAMSCASPLCENAWKATDRVATITLAGDGDRPLRVDERFAMVGVPNVAEVAE